MDEWRKAYINYHGLKKLIKRVQAHYDARKTQHVSVREDAATQVATHPAARLLRSSTSLFTRRVTEYGSINDPETQEELPPVSLEGTGLHLKGEVCDDAGKRDTDEGSQASEEDFEAFERDDLSASEAKPLLADTSVSPPESASTAGLRASPEPVDEPEQTIDSVLSRLFDDDELKFFGALDCEAERIVTFFENRQREAMERLSTLVEQLIELAEHRRAYKAKTRRMEGGQLGLKNILGKVPRSLDAKELQRLQLHAQGREMNPVERVPSSDEDTGHQRREHALEHLQNLHLCDVPELEPVHRRPHKQYNPVRYKAARKKLQTAVVENYRALEILNNYAILNRTGMNKILKKFDKALQVHVWQPYYEERVKHRSIVASSAVPQMLDALEEIYANYFEHGNRRRARDILRLGTTNTLLPHESGHNWATFVTGLYLGIAVCLAVEGLHSVTKASTRMRIPAWPQLLGVYAALFLPTLFALLFGVNLLGWQQVRINTVFIFETDAATAIEPAQYFELPALCLWLLSLCFYQSFCDKDGEGWAPTTWPLVWVCMVAFLLCNPLPIMHRSGRAWFLRSCARVLTGGLIGKVEFRDFFLGDEMNSIAYSVSNLWLMRCEYATDWAVPTQCNGSLTLWTPFLSSLPALLRLGQCVRRHCDARGSTYVHLTNAGKYASTVCHAFAYFAYRSTGSQNSGLFALWILCATINSCFTSAWDILMDWNLLHHDAPHPFLRANLSFEDVWPMYYFAMITNVMIRFAWTIYLFGSPSSVPVRAFIAATLEMLRRWQWNFLRLENEHVGNADTYKIVRELPLPYPVRRSRSIDADFAPYDARTSPTMAQPYDDNQAMASLAQTRRDLARHRQQTLPKTRGK